MNDVAILTAIGVLLTAIVFGIYVRRRKSARKGFPATSRLDRDAQAKNADASGEPPALFTPASIWAGAVRHPLREVTQMLGACLLFGIALVALSLFLYSDTPESRERWISLPFLALGLGWVAAGFYSGSRLDRASGVERIAGVLAFWLGGDLVQIACLTAGGVFLILAVVAAGIYERETGLMVLAVSSVLGILLAGIGLWRPRFSQWIFRIPGGTHDP